MKKFITLAGLAGATLLSASAFVMAQPTTALTDQEYERMFVEMDTNKDGRVSRTEYTNCVAVFSTVGTSRTKA